MDQKQIENIQRDLERRLRISIIYKDGAFRAANDKFEGSSKGDIICHYGEDDEVLLSCPPRDVYNILLSDFWKGDLADDRGYLTEEQNQALDGETFGGVDFCDEWDC